jgi:hypothetical protein
MKIQRRQFALPFPGAGSKLKCCKCSLHGPDGSTTASPLASGAGLTCGSEPFFDGIDPKLPSAIQFFCVAGLSVFDRLIGERGVMALDP